MKRIIPMILTVLALSLGAANAAAPGNEGSAKTCKQCCGDKCAKCCNDKCAECCKK